MAQNNFSIATTYHEIKRSIGCYMQRDQIGRFFKNLCNKIRSKRSPNDLQHFGQFWKTSLVCKTVSATL